MKTETQTQAKDKYAHLDKTFNRVYPGSIHAPGFLVFMTNALNAGKTYVDMLPHCVENNFVTKTGLPFSGATLSSFYGVMTKRKPLVRGPRGEKKSNHNKKDSQKRSESYVGGTTVEVGDYKMHHEYKQSELSPVRSVTHPELPISHTIADDYFSRVASWNIPFESKSAIYNILSKIK